MGSGGERRIVRSIARSVVVAALLIAVPQMAVKHASAEIPHENFDLVGSDLEMLVNLLNTSINYSEQSFVALYYVRILDADYNLSIVSDLLRPAEDLVDDIAGIADSYQSLNELLPPFITLADEEYAFMEMEVELLEKRSIILELGKKTDLTQDETLLAITTVNEATALIASMNEAADEMLASALDISALRVDDETPFANNSLAELIEKLRDLLSSIERDLADFIDGAGSDLWQDVEPFLTLWVEEDSYFLGEELSGGGYLFFDGVFRSGYEVTISFDGSELFTVTTSEYGRYNFSFEIPASADWLGLHQLVASATLYFGDVTASVSLFISRIPTTLTLWVEREVLAPTEDLLVVGTLEDVWGDPVVGGSCTLWVDLSPQSLATNDSGQFSWTMGAQLLGYGNHTLIGEYHSSIPYESCVSEHVNITVDIPTSLELHLFSSRFYVGYYVVGEGWLRANASEPLGDRIITLSIDGIQVDNVTTLPDGMFAFTLESAELSAGTHLLKAEFMYKPDFWRYVANETVFTIFTVRRTLDYPFWPFVPGWGGTGVPEQTYNIFFGDYAYLTWLVMIIIVAAVVKTLQIRRALSEKRAESIRRSKEAAAMTSVAGGDVSEEFFFGPVPESAKPPDEPNSRIVWEYNALTSFLTSKRKVALRKSMTHLEIARMLKAIGYPLNLVNGVTSLFEKAFYSGAVSRNSEMEVMVEYSSRMKDVERTGETSAP